MTNTTKHTVRTRRTRDGAVATAQLTLNWDGMSAEAIRAIATKTVIIKWQQPRKACKTDAMLKDKYNGSHILKVADIEWGRPRGPRDPVSATKKDMAKLTPEELLALLKEKASELSPEMRKGLWED